MISSVWLNRKRERSLECSQPKQDHTGLESQTDEFKVNSTGNVTHSQSNLKLSQLACTWRALTGAWCPNLWRFKALLHLPHFFMCISSQFPTAPCSCVTPIYVDVMPGFTLSVPQIHNFQIFYKLGNFLKMSGSHVARHIKERAIFRHHLGPFLLLPILCFFCFSTPFPHDSGKALLSFISFRTVPLMPLRGSLVLHLFPQYLVSYFF